MCGGNTEIKADGLGMSDVEVTVRFGREACLYFPTVFASFKSFSTICSMKFKLFFSLVSSLFISAIMLLFSYRGDKDRVKKMKNEE